MGNVEEIMSMYSHTSKIKIICLIDSVTGETIYEFEFSKYFRNSATIPPCLGGLSVTEMTISTTKDEEICLILHIE